MPSYQFDSSPTSKFNLTMADSQPAKKTGRRRRKPSSSRQPSPCASDSEQDGDGGMCPTCSGNLPAMEDKLDKILASINNVEQRLTSLELKYHDVNNQVMSNKSDLADLKSSVTLVHDMYDNTKKQLDKKIEYNLNIIRKLEDKIDDIHNRSRRNNIVIQGVPEGSEAGSESCEDFVSGFLANHMQLEGADGIEIDRAHRTGQLPATSGTPRPRPIHCRLLRYADRQFILKNASKHLKNNKYKEHNIYITDDVTPKVRGERKELRESYLRRIQKDERVHFAYIPWSVPALIRYKIRDGPFRSFRLGGAA